MFPFVFKSFKVSVPLSSFSTPYSSRQEYYDFTLQLEDEIIPDYLDSIDNFADKYSIDTKRKTKRLFRRSSKKDQELQVNCISLLFENQPYEQDIIEQLACFHPEFQWADCPDFNSPLNFEKRSPFPTINILRSKRIRELASEVRIASNPS